MTALYNDNDAYCGAWLGNLIAAGHLPQGTVDVRDIAQLSACDVAGYRQAHFFAGIGGWPLALEMAGWSPTRPVWTGSCPCQPFSSAGKRQGTADKRHLWPEFLRLIAECHPATIFGEQVASKDGREWLAGVRADLEALGYAVGATDLCSASVGAPHIRQRLFWVADTEFARLEGRAFSEMDNAGEPAKNGRAGGMVDANPDGCHRSAQRLARSGPSDCPDRQTVRSSAWSDSIWLPCLDGKARRIESTIQPLAYGIPNRMGLLRGSGNAIVPQVAAQFIGAWMDVIEAV